MLTGTVRGAEKGVALPFASVGIREAGVGAVTNNEGVYRLVLPAGTLQRRVLIQATYVGRQDTTIAITLTPGTTTRLDFRLREQNLSLREIEVNARRSGDEVSNSAIVIGRQAIEQTQAYSVADVLQLLPGQTITNLNAQGARSINLRSAVLSGTLAGAGGNHNLNNSFGTAILVDGAAWSNNGNLQMDDPGRFQGYRNFSVPSANAANSYSSGNYAASSIDLKQIPANNIESVEVIQGVASARYGDLTSGAIIINRQAGATPARISFRTQSGTAEVALSKGFGLKKGQALNVSATYLYSNDEPQFPTKSFNRLTGTLLWTTRYGREGRHRHTLGLDAHTTLDDARTDPDAFGQQRTSSLDQRVAITNRGTLQFTNLLSGTINYQFGGSYGYQRSNNYFYLNGGVRPVTDRLISGTHEGQFTPANYPTERTIEGKPVNLYARIDHVFSRELGNWTHTLTSGLSASYDRNLGAGRQFDPIRPRWPAQDGKGERSFRFTDIPAMVQLGAFLENQAVRQWGPRRLVANLGLRFDYQNQVAVVSPRLNLKLYLSDALQLNAAYGVATKAPGLIHRYPGLLYFDIPVVVNYTNNFRENLFLVHTEVVNPANPALRPARSETMEVGFNYRKKGYELSVTAYQKMETDGFSVGQQLLSLSLPNYRVASRPANLPPVLTSTGPEKRHTYTYGRFGNVLNSTSTGLEVLFRTPRIRSISSSFDMNLALTSSDFSYDDSYLTYSEPPESSPDYLTVRYIRYPGLSRRSYQLIQTLSSTHHLPQLGFVLTLRGQVFWGRWSQNQSPFQYADGLLLADGTYRPLTAEAFATGQFNRYRNIISTDLQSQPFPYGVVHMRISKELGKMARLSFSGNNILNIRPEFIPEPQRTIQVFNQSPTFGAELTLTF